MGLKRSKSLTLILIYMAGIMERADESLLPGVYKEVGAALHADPTRLGSLTLFRSIVQSSCYPIAAYLSVRHNRAHIIALGAFLWAAATFLVGFSTTFLEVAISRGLNGIGLALVIPAIQSLVADSTDETNRGAAFAWLQLSGNFGSIIGSISSILIASTSFMGIAGWRIAFHLVGIISVVVGILVRLFADDPLYSNSKKIPKQPFLSELKDLVKEAKSVMRVPSFQIIVAQGVAGSFPGSALSFAPMWLELIGFSHKTVATLWALFAVAGSIGGLFGGYMGDFLGQRFPNTGRILLSQISSFSGIPFAAILLLVLPYDSSTAFMHGLVLVIFGFFRSWNVPATNGPIFAEIVPERSRTCIYALDRCFETVLASFAPPVVGVLSQHVFGFKPVKAGATGSEEIETDRDNAASLAKALYAAIGIPIGVCCIIYSFLYCSYPRDRERVRMQALIESEMGKMEEDDEKIDLVVFGERGDGGDEDVLGKKVWSEIELEYGEELEFDENNDKKSLISSSNHHHHHHQKTVSGG